MCVYTYVFIVFIYIYIYIYAIYVYIRITKVYIGFLVSVQLLAMCRGMLSAVITQLMSKCL